MVFRSMADIRPMTVCRGYGPLTTELCNRIPNPALLAAIDHVLQRHNEAALKTTLKLTIFWPQATSTVVNSSSCFSSASSASLAIARPDARARQLDESL